MNYFKLFVLIAISFFLITTGCDQEFENSGAKEVSIQAVMMDDLALGIQLADKGTVQMGEWEYTGRIEVNGGISPWVCDDNCFDPDSARLDLDSDTQAIIRNKDFRVCIQASDNSYEHSAQGAWQCTNWASNGNSLTGMATDANGMDPDSYRLRIQTRTWPTNSRYSRLRDYRFRIRAWDKNEPGVWSTPTGWASSGGGYSGWATDKNGFDPDGLEIDMQVQLAN